jgi:hypothetical protein
VDNELPELLFQSGPHNCPQPKSAELQSTYTGCESMDSVVGLPGRVTRRRGVQARFTEQRGEDSCEEEIARWLETEAWSMAATTGRQNPRYSQRTNALTSGLKQFA